MKNKMKNEKKKMNQIKNQKQNIIRKRIINKSGTSRKKVKEENKRY